MFRTTFRSARILGLACVAGFLMAGCPCIPGTDFLYFPDSNLEAAVRASLHKPFGCLSHQDALDLRTLDASGLGISSLEGLSECVNLTELDLSSNSIRSITGLTNLQNLVTLDLANNKITRVDAVAGLFLLRSLDISGADNDIRDFTPLSANALNGGLGDGAVVTLSNEWTVDSEGNISAAFQNDYNVLINEGVSVIFAESTPTGTAK